MGGDDHEGAPVHPLYDFMQPAGQVEAGEPFVLRQVELSTRQLACAELSHHARALSATTFAPAVALACDSIASVIRCVAVASRSASIST